MQLSYSCVIQIILFVLFLCIGSFIDSAFAATHCNTLQRTTTVKHFLSYSSVSGPSSTPCGVATISRLLKGGPEPLKKEIHDILGSKREDRFSDPFFDYVQTTSLVRFSYLLRLCNFCKAPRDMRKFPQKCQKIAGC